MTTMAFLWTKTPFLTEFLLAICVLFAVLCGAFYGNKSKKTIELLATLTLVFSVFALISETGEATQEFNGAFFSDAFTRFMKIVTLLGGLFSLLLSVSSFDPQKKDRFEYPILLLLSTLGMAVVISAGDLIVMYIGLELQSFALYVLVALSGKSTKTSEAGVKYFILGSLASGIFLYGLSLLYGTTTTISFEGIRQFSQSGSNSFTLIFGLVFIIAGLVFKLSAVPFHMWAPDIYEGASTPVVAFLSSAPKVAAITILARLLYTLVPEFQMHWQPILIFISAASMILGTLGAMAQTNLKRLIAYSAIANMGYALIGLSTGTQEGLESVILFMTIYIFSTLGFFGCLLLLSRNGPVDVIDDLSGVARIHPFIALLMFVFLTSFIGMPPLAGFIGKFYLLSAAISANLLPLAIIGVLASVVSAFYYLRLAKTVYFDDAPSTPRPSDAFGFCQRFVAIGCAAFVSLLWLFPYPLKKAINTAVSVLF